MGKLTAYTATMNFCYYFFLLWPHDTILCHVTQALCFRSSGKKIHNVRFHHQYSFKIQLNCTLDHLTKTVTINVCSLNWLAKREPKLKKWNMQLETVLKRNGINLFHEYLTLLFLLKYIKAQVNGDVIYIFLFVLFLFILRNSYFVYYELFATPLKNS